MRVVLDTNVITSALLGSARGGCRQLLRWSLTGKITPLIGPALFQEMEDVFARDELFADCALTRRERAELLNAYFSTCEWVKVYFSWRPNLRDESDNHLIELAVAGGAQILCTQNLRDFRGAELAFDKLQILSPAQFIKEQHGNLDD